MADLIPRLADIRGAAAWYLYQNRRKAYEHLNSGRWGDFIEGWVAQAAVCRARLADEMLSARLPFSEGAALLELALSEYFIETLPAQTTAVGEMSLVRLAGSYTAGEIKAGHRFRKEAKPASTPPVTGASYVAERTVVVNQGETSTFVPVVATAPGDGANTPVGLPDASAEDPLYDTNWLVSGVQAAGGGLVPTDDVVRSLARQTYTGRQGPNAAAILAGVLSAGRGVAHAEYFEDPAAARGVVYVADSSWAHSARFVELLEQDLRGRPGTRPWLGFGAKVDVMGILSSTITVTATIQVREAVDENELTAELAKKARWYFDERPGWWTYRKNTLASALCSVDPRIIGCPSVEVRYGNAIVAESAQRWQPDGYTKLPHLLLASNGLRVTFTTP
jgi:hypothetical protein